MNPMKWSILGKVGEGVSAPAPDSLPACFFDFAHRLSFGPNGA